MKQTHRMIRPVSDLRNNFADISRTVHETQQPVFLTKNGFGDMVVLSMECYDELRLDSEIYLKACRDGAQRERTKALYAFRSERKTRGDAPWIITASSCYSLP